MKDSFSAMACQDLSACGEIYRPGFAFLNRV
jgi:hypothetical protein